MSNLTLLILGLLITNIMHLITALPNMRQTLIEKVGKISYIATYAILSSLGLAFIIYGYMDRDFTVIFDNQIWQLHLNKLLMLFALILLSAQFFNGYIKAELKQTAIIAVLIWAAGHLLANGDLYSVILFTGFIIYALVALYLKKQSNETLASPKWLHDLISFLVGFILYAILFMSHEHFTGMPLF